MAVVCVPLREGPAGRRLRRRRHPPLHPARAIALKTWRRTSMPRREPALDEEKRSYGALWLVLSLLLFVGALWAIADDNIFRRPWKKYQAEFNRLEIARLKKAIADEQARLDADPAYQGAAKALADARARIASGEDARRLAALRRQLVTAREAE